MAVYYKFKSAKDYDSILVDGQFISVASLKEKIFESKHLGGGTDFDLLISNPQTNEEYADDAMLIPKNTSVLVRRVPGRPCMPIVTDASESNVVANKMEEAPPPKRRYAVAESFAAKFSEESDWDEFGSDLYAVLKVQPAQCSAPPAHDVPRPSKGDEDSKIKALIDTPPLDWQRLTQESSGPGRDFGRGLGGRVGAGRGYGRGGGWECKTPPQGYVCHRCNVPGHFIQHCATNGDPNYDMRKVKPPTGIPKSMLIATSDGSYVLPSGAVAVLRPNEAAFQKEIGGLPTNRSLTDLPPELRCPLCKEVMKDAVLTSKCCFNSFCDKCIRDFIISKFMCICGATNARADDLLPNKTLRETISRVLESTTGSAENGGSLLQVQDLESARCSQTSHPKLSSPTISTSAKDVQVPCPHKVENPNVLQPANEGNAAFKQKSLEICRAIKNPEVSEVTPGFMTVKEPKYQGSAPLPEEEVQQKLSAIDPEKREKRKAWLRDNAADLQWRTSQHTAAENYPMPFGPSAYNQHWSGGMQWGMNGYMGYNSTNPYMGYTTSSFSAPFGGGTLCHGPFGGPGYNLTMPVVQHQRSLLALGMASNSVAPQVMNIEELEARRANIKRKREMERSSGRGSSKERGFSKEQREVRSNGYVSSMKSNHERASSLHR